MTALDILRALGACSDAIEWVKAQPDQSPDALWRECQRADWLAWYLGKLAARDGHGSPAHRRAVLVACLCARSVSRYWRGPECERALALAERWAWGDETVTLDDLHAAAYAAYAANANAANAAYTAAAAAANTTYAADAYAAANTTYAAADAAYAAADAAYAANANANANAAAVAAAARTAHLASLADLIRAAVPEVPA